MCGIVAASGTATLQSITQLPEIKMDKWELLPSEIIMEDTLGEGAFGLVYKAFIARSSLSSKVGQSYKCAATVTVAVKILKGNLCFDSTAQL